LFSILRKRLEHLQNLSENLNDPDVLRDYFQKRLDRIIADYLLRESFFDSANSYIQENNIKDFTDLDVFDETNKIYLRLKEKDCQEALSWCNIHKTKL